VNRAGIALLSFVFLFSCTLLSSASAGLRSSGWQLVGDNVIGGQCYEPLTPTQEGHVLNAVALVGGQAAADDLAAKLEAGEVNLVHTPNKSGESDANTIGIDLSQSTGVVGAVALHEAEHQERAASQPGATASSGDPLTSWGDISDDGSCSNPCGGMEHAAMGVTSMERLGAYACGPFPSVTELEQICRDWFDMRNRIITLFHQSKNAGCPTSQTGAEFTSSVLEKPGCCP